MRGRGAPLWGGPLARHPYLVASLVTIAAAAAIGFVIPWVQSYPQAWQLSTGTFWSRVVEWINVNFFDTLEAVKNFFLLNLLVPFKRFLAGLPWLCLLYTSPSPRD